MPPAKLHPKPETRTPPPPNGLNLASEALGLDDHQLQLNVALSPKGAVAESQDLKSFWLIETGLRQFEGFGAGGLGFRLSHTGARAGKAPVGLGFRVSGFRVTRSMLNNKTKRQRGRSPETLRRREVHQKRGHKEKSFDPDHCSCGVGVTSCYLF